MKKYHVKKGDKVVVKGSNLSTDKHFVKPRNAQQRGGIIEKERAIDVSNVMIICPSCGKATRIGVQISQDENGKKVKTRVCKKCGESLDKRKSVRATKIVNILCGDCMVKMEPAE